MDYKERAMGKEMRKEMRRARVADTHHYQHDVTRVLGPSLLRRGHQPTPNTSHTRYGGIPKEETAIPTQTSRSQSQHLGFPCVHGLR